jgi:hypothetical protein
MKSSETGNHRVETTFSPRTAAKTMGFNACTTDFETSAIEMAVIADSTQRWQDTE